MYELDITAEQLLKEALEDGYVLETEVAGLKDAEGNIDMDELVGIIADRDDGEWLEQFEKKGAAYYEDMYERWGYVDTEPYTEFDCQYWYEIE